MPTNNPRLTVTLDSSTAELLKRLSKLTGDSRSKIISEILDQSAPVFARMVSVLEAAEKASEQARKSVKVSSASRLMQAQAQIEQQLGIALESMEQTTAELLQRSEGGQPEPGRASDTSDSSPLSPPPKALSATVEPPYLTGGSGSRNPLKTNKTGKIRHGQV